MEDKCVKICGDCEIKGSLRSHEEAKSIMDAKKDEIRGNASPLVGGIVGETSAFLSAYERPAIVITDRIGDAESTIEFATAADYKAWKELE